MHSPGISTRKRLRFDHLLCVTGLSCCSCKLGIGFGQMPLMTAWLCELAQNDSAEDIVCRIPYYSCFPRHDAPCQPFIRAAVLCVQDAQGTAGGRVWAAHQLQGVFSAGQPTDASIGQERCVGGWGLPGDPRCPKQCPAELKMEQGCTNDISWW